MKKLGCILFLTFASCSVELPDSKTLIEELYNQRVKELLSRKDSECRVDALADAEAHVDSLLYIPARLIDTLSFPSRPSKPLAPEHIIGKVKKFHVEERGAVENKNRQSRDIKS